MIQVIRDPEDVCMMRIDLQGSAEQIAQEYVGLTLKLLDEYPYILKRAQWYLDDIDMLRAITKDEDKI